MILSEGGLRQSHCEFAITGHTLLICIHIYRVCPVMVNSQCDWRKIVFLGLFLPISDYLRSDHQYFM